MLHSQTWSSLSKIHAIHPCKIDKKLIIQSKNQKQEKQSFFEKVPKFSNIIKWVFSNQKSKFFGTNMIFVFQQFIFMPKIALSQEKSWRKGRNKFGVKTMCKLQSTMHWAVVAAHRADNTNFWPLLPKTQIDLVFSAQVSSCDPLVVI